MSLHDFIQLFQCDMTTVNVLTHRESRHVHTSRYTSLDNSDRSVYVLRSLKRRMAVDTNINEEHFTVSIKGDGVTVEKSVPAHVARQMISLIMGGTVSYEPLPREEAPIFTNDAAGLAHSSRPGSRRTSLREFLEETQATRHPDKITAIAQYLALHEKADLFTRDEIKGRYRSAGEAAPANFPRDFGWAVRNGWIAEDSKSSGSFYVTSKGRAAVENKFSDEDKKATVQPSGRKRSRKAGRARPPQDDTE
jgi:hypothetical protein